MPESQINEQTVRLRDAGKPEFLNTSRTTVYKLRDDPDFKRMVPIFYLFNTPYVYARDLAAFKNFLHRRALETGKRKVGRPRKSRAA